MCGRARLSSDVSEIKLVFSIPPHRPTPNIAPSWNVAPTDALPIVRYDAKAGERSLDVMRWGLVPFWAKDIKVGFSNIYAKAEGIEGKPAFRAAFQWRRCLVLVDTYYERMKTAAGNHAYAIALADRRLTAVAGFWERWRSPAAKFVRSFATVTMMGLRSLGPLKGGAAHANATMWFQNSVRNTRRCANYVPFDMDDAFGGRGDARAASCSASKGEFCNFSPA
jgi:putative SOS response-associated peptidase YedK